MAWLQEQWEELACSSLPVQEETSKSWPRVCSAGSWQVWSTLLVVQGGRETHLGLE